MTEQQQDAWLDVQYRMDAEGFHYCFESYSDFEDIEDEEFHRIRRAYLGAAARLENYINKKCEEFN